ncbi:uncharacterized protein [Linepithema humile]|uniref:uncharacterized protein isoform X2 n=1 Tax=Linepithema humile TaxID=83485 RepID=UPI00351F0A38
MGQPTPRYGQQTPSHHQGPFVHPPPPSMTPSHHRSTQSHRPTPPLSTPSGDPTDWKKAAEAWARLKSGSRVSGSTPRHGGKKQGMMSQGKFRVITTN